MKTAKKRFITAEDLYELQTINQVRISPDGKRIIFVAGGHAEVVSCYRF